MATWGEFPQSHPGLAEAGRALLYQFGFGLAFLAMVRRDGGPRVHPMCPLIHGGACTRLSCPRPSRGSLDVDSAGLCGSGWPSRVLGSAARGEVAYTSEEICAVKTGGAWLATVRIADYRPPPWPDPPYIAGCGQVCLPCAGPVPDWFGQTEPPF